MLSPGSRVQYYARLDDPVNEEGSYQTSTKVRGALKKPYQTIDSNTDFPQTTSSEGHETDVGTVNKSKTSATSGPRTGASQITPVLTPGELLPKKAPGYYVIADGGTTPTGEHYKVLEKEKVNSYRTKDFDPQLEFPPVSYTRSMINMFNNMIGTTILALPYAMLEVGLSAPIVMVLTVASVYQSSIFLLESLHEDGNLSKRQLRYYYWHVSSAAFGKWGSVFMANFQRLAYLLDNGWALVLSSNSMDSVVNLGNFYWIMIFCGIIIAECILFPNQKSLSWISMIGIFNTLVCCVTLIVIATMRAIGEKNLWNSFEGVGFFDTKGFFVSFNIMVLSFCTILVIPNIYMEMEKKYQAKSLLYWGHMIPMVLKQVFMVIVFYAFQSETNEIAILSVDETYLRGVLAVTITVDKLVTVPLWLYPNRVEIEAAFWNNVKPTTRKTFKGNTMARNILTFMVSSSLLVPSIIIAYLVPSYWDCSVLIGSIIATPLQLLIPNIQWFILTKRKPIWKQVMAIGVFLLGLVCSVGGLFVTIYTDDLM